MKVVVIVQARMGSTRLPGKVLKLLGGKTVLQHVIERVQAAQRVDQVVVATTTDVKDDPIVEESERWGAGVFRGSEHDVLERYYLAAQACKAEVIVRITSDCPLIDSAVLDAMLVQFIESQAAPGACDYLSNAIERTFPRGLDVEVFTFAVLARAYREAAKPYEREHVTPYLYQSGLFSLKNFAQTGDDSAQRWTLDTPEDYAMLNAVFAAAQDGKLELTMNGVLNYLSCHPEVHALNASVAQKGLPNA